MRRGGQSQCGEGSRSDPPGTDLAAGRAAGDESLGIALRELARQVGQG